MFQEFVEKSHLTLKERNNRNIIYLEYERSKYESKAFQIGIISGLALSGYFYFHRSNYIIGNFNRIFYSLNLGLIIHLLMYEAIDKMYTDKYPTAKIDCEIFDRINNYKNNDKNSPKSKISM